MSTSPTIDRTRRRAMKAVAAGMLGAPWWSAFGAAGDTDATRRGELLKRAIPATGELLPVIGLGTARAFDVGSDDSQRAGLRGVVEALASVEQAMIDTSPMYGRAETVVGDLVAGLGLDSRFFLATKVWTTGRDAGIAQMNESFERLRTGRIDLMQIHNLLDWRVHLPVLREWRDAGRIRHVGVTHYHEGAHDDIAAVIAAEAFDFLQINYSLAEPEAGDRLLALAADRGTAVIVNRPFGRGELFRATRGKALPAWAADYGAQSWAQLFLKWVIAHPAVTVAIPGTGKPAHMLDNLGAAYGPLPDAAGRGRIARLVADL